MDKAKSIAPVFVAIDTPDLRQAISISQQLAPYVTGIKLGLEFFLAHGPQGIEAVTSDISETSIFLDLKLHDIPNTVAKAIHSLAALNVDYLTVHTSGGLAMLQAAQQATTERNGPKLLGVTMLTSLSQQDLQQQNISADPINQVLSLTTLAQQASLAGVVASAQEAAAIRANHQDLEIITPGIRPTWAAANDQQRITTPKEAMNAGATYLVIGRPITAAENPVDAVQRIAAEL